jgi:hypothetical protein
MRLLCSNCHKLFYLMSIASPISAQHSKEHRNEDDEDEDNEAPAISHTTYSSARRVIGLFIRKVQTNL